jgi:hypothetical protein
LPGLDDTLILAALILLAALLYSSVGHAGASGYLAVMALMGLAPEAMRPTALILNILVASIATIRFARAGYFVWRDFYPFALTSIPAAFIGGALALPSQIYKPVVGVILLLAAAELMRSARRAAEGEAVHPDPGVPLAWALPIGAGVGLLSGLTGTGGGIFLSPILLFARWVGMRRSACVAAAFILCNSIAGLTGTRVVAEALPPDLALLLGAAGVGGLIGSQFGSHLLPIAMLRRLLSLVLAIAGLKLIAF